MSEIELLPCPFCGGEPRKLKDDNGNWAQVSCNSCEGRGPENPNEAKAIAGWNRRTLAELGPLRPAGTADKYGVPRAEE